MVKTIEDKEWVYIINSTKKHKIKILLVTNTILQTTDRSYK